jgi:predicted dehydrogenase
VNARARSGAGAAPRLGFLGVGWIGRHRLEAIAHSGLARIVALADPCPGAAAEASGSCPDAAVLSSLEELLTLDLDGIAIATPSALHATQSLTALRLGLSVFCQKPLARTGKEARGIVEAARDADRLLAVDFSYRFSAAMQRIRTLVRDGELGEVYAARLTFHNAYGPDKAWFRDASQSGGGCVIDLGIHLVDLALWVLDGPRVSRITHRLFARGVPLTPVAGEVEDYATIRLDLDTGAAADLACSWCLPAGRPAAIEMAFYGTRAGAALRNVEGSYYDFLAELYRGTTTTTLVTPPDPWGGRAAVQWARQLAAGGQYDPGVESVIPVADVVDAVYLGLASPRAGPSPRPRLGSNDAR